MDNLANTRGGVNCHNVPYKKSSGENGRTRMSISRFLLCPGEEIRTSDARTNDRAVSTLLKIIKISFKKNSSNKILVNGGQVGEHYKRINHCFSRTIEDDSLFELKEELIVINEPLRKTVTYLGYLTETYRDFRQRQFFTRKTFHGVRSVEEKTRSPDYFCEGKFNHKTLDNVNEAIEDFWGLTDERSLALRSGEDEAWDLSLIDGIVVGNGTESALKWFFLGDEVRVDLKQLELFPVQLGSVFKVDFTPEQKLHLKSSQDAFQEESGTENASENSGKAAAEEDSGGTRAEENGSGMRSWETVKRSLKIAAGCAGVAMAMFAAYKFFR